MNNLGLGSYAYRYAIGISGFEPVEPMGLVQLGKRARGLGYGFVQACDNLKLDSMASNEIDVLATQFKELGLGIEIGMNGLNKETLLKHIELCCKFGAKKLRVVIGNEGASQSELYQHTKKILSDIKKILVEKGLMLLLENHFDLQTKEMVRLVEELNDDNIKLIFDTTNSIGFNEKPEVTLDMMLPYIRSVHLKDYTMIKTEAAYEMKGMELGKGDLPVSELLGAVNNATENIDIVLELTTRRDKDSSIESVIAWENQMVKNSTAYLKSLIES